MIYYNHVKRHPLILSPFSYVKRTLLQVSQPVLSHIPLQDYDTASDGEWIKTDAYETCLRRLCQSLNFKVTNNHAFRMSLNSNVLIPAGLPVTERARILGHSVETNLKYYSFAGKDSLADICELLNNLA